MLTLLDSAQNMLQNDDYISHHTLKTLLHYFVKPSCLKNCINSKIQQHCFEKKFMRIYVTHLHFSRHICGCHIAQTLIQSTTRSGALCSTEFTWQCQGSGRLEAPSDWRVVWYTAEPHRRPQQPVAWTSPHLYVFEPDVDTSNIRFDSRISQTLRN